MRDTKQEHIPAVKPAASRQPADWKVTAEYVALFPRAGAALLDLIILMIPFSIFFKMLLDVLWGGSNDPTEIQLALARATTSDGGVDWALFAQLFPTDFLKRWLAENLLFTVLACILWVGLWYWYSATPGKMLMKMKIVDAETGMPPSTGQNILRFIGYHVSLLVFGLGMFWIMWDKRRRAWHDMMAGTVVVYKKSLPQELAEATRHTR